MANTPLNIPFSPQLSAGQTLAAIAKRTVVGATMTNDITFADFVTSDTFRVISSRPQAVTITVTVFYK